MLLRAMPPALVAAIAMSLTSWALLLCQRLVATPLPAHVSLIVWGTTLAEVALLAAGMFELARRLSGAARRCAHAAGAIFAVLLIWRLCRDALEVLDHHSRVDLFRGSMVLHGVLATAAAALLATAVSGWTRAPVASVVSILVVLGQGFIPGLDDVLTKLFDAHPRLAKLYGSTLDLVSALALIRLIAVGVRDRETTIADPVAAASGARIAALALWLRIVLAGVLALPVAALLFVPELSVLLLRAGLLVETALAVLCAAGLLRLAGSRIEGLPASRLIAGVTLVLWWAGIEVAKLARYAELIQFSEGAVRDTELLEAWSIAGPLISAVGLVLAGSSIVAWAEARGAQQLRESAVSRTIVFAILSTFSVVPVGIDSTRALGLSAVFGLLSIIGLVALAGLLSRAAEALASGPTLPAARVIVPTVPTERRGNPDPAAPTGAPQDPSARE